MTEMTEMTLQQAFLNFKLQRQSQSQHNIQQSLNEEKRDEDDEKEKIAKLRSKFIKIAMSYIGVPYSKLYHQLGSVDYDSPLGLFLDCCGLIRKVMRDLEDDVGFRIGNGNQGYQFDMLPDDNLTSTDQLHAGDLIFYSGTYYNNNKQKRQKHDMVHVEIYMGEGSKTLAARLQSGHVQLFDDYRFESKNYHSVQHHFKSINSWLKGEFKSHCSMPEHQYHQYHHHQNSNVIRNPLSIFYSRDQNNNQNNSDIILTKEKDEDEDEPSSDTE